MFKALTFSIFSEFGQVGSEVLVMNICLRSNTLNSTYSLCMVLKFKAWEKIDQKYTFYSLLPLKYQHVETAPIFKYADVTPNFQ
jgi:hypothetical protein